MKKLDTTVTITSTVFKDKQGNPDVFNPVELFVLPLLKNPPQHRGKEKNALGMPTGGSLNLDVMIKFLPLIVKIEDGLKAKDKAVPLEQADYDLMMETINANTEWTIIDIPVVQYLKTLRELPDVKVTIDNPDKS